MKEHPILFSGEMVRAILDDRKTQTRRVVKPEPHGGMRWNPIVLGGYAGWTDGHGSPRRCPYGVPGDRLWVRETWGYRGSAWTMGKPNRTVHIAYRADDSHRRFSMPYATREEWEPNLRHPEEGLDQFEQNEHWRKEWKRWRPSIHMPRWASRLTLEVTGVRVERLQEISEWDCYKEGRSLDLEMDPVSRPGAVWFRDLWDTLNAKRGFSWESNPWAWVVEFRRVEP